MLKAKCMVPLMRSLQIFPGYRPRHISFGILDLPIMLIFFRKSSKILILHCTIYIIIISCDTLLTYGNLINLSCVHAPLEFIFKMATRGDQRLRKFKMATRPFHV